MIPDDFKPLSGIKILDFSHVVAGPFATFLLAQLGAEVWKVEHPDGGDVMRSTERGARSFLALNHGKEQLRLDLRADDDHQRAMDLMMQCDVLVDNLRPGALTRLGLGYEDVSVRRPDIIYCAISGFGRMGDWRNRPAYDHIVQAATGMAWLNGQADDPPMKTGFPVIDAGTGMLAAFAVVAALRDRDRTGKGCLLDIAMTQAALHLMYPMSCESLGQGTSPARVGNQGFSGSPAADFFPCQDGWIAIGANTPAQLAALLEELSLADLLMDPVLFDAPSPDQARSQFARTKDAGKVKSLLRQRIMTQSGAELEDRLAARGVPAARVKSMAEFIDSARQAGGLREVILHGEPGVTAMSPGLGFAVQRAIPPGT